MVPNGLGWTGLFVAWPRNTLVSAHYVTASAWASADGRTAGPLQLALSATNGARRNFYIKYRCPQARCFRVDVIRNLPTLVTAQRVSTVSS